MAGYPAWAGIDRHVVAGLVCGLGLPRVGGDRPRPGLAYAWWVRVTPRGRG